TQQPPRPNSPLHLVTPCTNLEPRQRRKGNEALSRVCRWNTARDFIFAQRRGVFRPKVNLSDGVPRVVRSAARAKTRGLRAVGQKDEQRRGSAHIIHTLSPTRGIGSVHTSRGCRYGKAVVTAGGGFRRNAMRPCRFTTSDGRSGSARWSSQRRRGVWVGRVMTAGNTNCQPRCYGRLCRTLPAGSPSARRRTCDGEPCRMRPRTNKDECRRSRSPHNGRSRSIEACT
ncbi:hypothetical protein IscW_ISCW004256, partial [Ixodes scapularis]